MLAKSASRIAQIDFLRGSAILLVIGEHCQIPPNQAGQFSSVATFLRGFGWTGVDLFFVLSGFLIGGLLFVELLRDGKLNAGRFIIRRGFKIWPLYCLYLLASTITAAHTDHISLGKTFRRLMPQYLHLQNYYPPDITLAVPLGHTWSLAVEEHFYLLLPILLLLLTYRRLPKSLPALPFVGVAVMLGCLAWRLQLPDTPWAPEVHYYPTHVRIDSLFAGVMLAYFWHFHPAYLQPLLKRPAVLLLCGGLLLSPMFVQSMEAPFAWKWGYSLLYLGYGCILLACMATTRAGSKNTVLARLFRARPVRAVAWIGFYSYPIYIVHLLAVLAVYPWTAAIPSESIRWIANNVSNVLLSIVFGVVAGRLIEVPMLALRDRLFPSDKRRPVATIAVAGSISAAERGRRAA